MGVPYLKGGRSLDGCDCLGLYVLLNRHRLSREVHDPQCTIFSAIRRSIARQSEALYREVSEPREGDAILLRHRGFPIHVGYCIDENHMLHSVPDRGSLVEPWTGIKWKSRVIGVYRYAE